MTKKYKLKCFSCGYKFKNKSEVSRMKDPQIRKWKSKPLCNVCFGDIMSSSDDSIADVAMEEVFGSVDSYLEDRY